MVLAWAKGKGGKSDDSFLDASTNNSPLPAMPARFRWLTRSSHAARPGRKLD
jgi:hypothetical protein